MNIHDLIADDVPSKYYRFLKRAFEEATKSNALHAHGAVIVKGNRIISSGWSQDKTHPLLLEYHTLVDKLHAETHAVFRRRHNEDFNGSTIFVVRLRKGNKPGLSRPCDLCAKILEEYGVNKAIYSEQDGTVSYMEI